MTRREYPKNVNFLVHLLINADIPSEILMFTFKVFIDGFNPNDVMEIFLKSTYQEKPLVNVVTEFSSLRVVRKFLKFKKRLTDKLAELGNVNGNSAVQKLMSPDILKLPNLRLNYSVATALFDDIEKVFSSAEVSEIILKCEPFKLEIRTKIFLENLFLKHLTDENFKTLFKFDHRWKYLEKFLSSLNTPDQTITQKALMGFFKIVHGSICNNILIRETFQWAFERFTDAESMKCFAEKCLMGALYNTNDPKDYKTIINYIKVRIGDQEFLKVLKNADTFFDWNFEDRGQRIHGFLMRKFSCCLNESEKAAFELNKNFVITTGSV